MVSKRVARSAALVGAASLALGACATPVAGPGGRYAAPIGTAPVMPTSRL